MEENQRPADTAVAGVVCRTCNGSQQPAMGARGRVIACHACGYQVTGNSEDEAIAAWVARNTAPA